VAVGQDGAVAGYVLSYEYDADTARYAEPDRCARVYGRAGYRLHRRDVTYGLPAG
jgi:hypothetical protein